MPESELKFIKKCAEFKTLKEVKHIPRSLRGIFTLLKYRPRLKTYDVVYIGLGGTGARSGIRSRVNQHLRSKKKRDLWTHFSIFEVWDNITGDEIRELEGLFRYIYRRDTRANRLNRQKGFK